MEAYATNPQGSESELSVQATNLKQFHLDHTFNDDIVGNGKYRERQQPGIEDSAIKPVLEAPSEMQQEPQQ